MRITMIGHSTVLIELAGRRVLTDPYFGTWGNPAYARPAPPAKARQALTDVDLVLISHHHWDHVDAKFLRMLADDVIVVVPRRATWITKLHGAKNVVGLGAWEARQMADLTITAVPAFHLALSVGFVVQGGGHAVYFAGDTYYRSAAMQTIGQRFELDVALMPVTTYRLPMTMNEAQAVQATRDLHPTVVIPIHEGLRPRSPLLRTSQTPAGFARRLAETDTETQVVILQEGEHWK